MTVKPFDQATFDADDNAKHAVIDLFAHWNVALKVNGDQYGIDLIGVDKQTGQFCAAEVEVKHNWHGPHFPFETVHYAARKIKFLEIANADRHVYFCTVNDDRTHCLILCATSINQCKLIRKQTSVTDSEWFIEIPLHLFDTYPL